MPSIAYINKPTTLVYITHLPLIIMLEIVGPVFCLRHRPRANGVSNGLHPDIPQHLRIFSTYWCWDNDRVHFSQFQVISILRMYFTGPRSFILNFDKSCHLISFIKGQELAANSRLSTYTMRKHSLPSGVWKTYKQCSALMQMKPILSSSLCSVMFHVHPACFNP